MQKMRPVLAPGATVALRGEPWRVSHAERFEACTLLSLSGAGTGNQSETLRVLTPFDRPRLQQRPRRVRLAGRHSCLRSAARAAADAHPWRGLWAASRASIDLLAWQLEPALAVVAGATRVLLADAVGLGKTIQAGLILAELLARGLIDRALVLTPAGLRAQWRQELDDRFGIDAVELDQSAIAEAVSSLPIGANPWATASVIVSSIDLVKRPEHLSAIEHVDFDVLVVDEAHHLTPGTDRGGVAARLASVCPWTIMVTATPHSGNERAFSFLQSIGSTRGDRLAVFRRSGEDVSRPSRRRARLCAVRPTPAEGEMLRAVTVYARAIWQARGSVDESARLVATVLARRAASSSAALLRTLERRRALMRGATDPVQPPLPWEENDERDDVEPEALLRVPGLADAATEASQIDRLIVLAKAAGVAPSKARWLVRFVRRIDEPAVIFSEYRDTIEDLARRFQAGDVALLHGALSPAERRAAMHAFVTGRARVLLATDAAGEGLNLQARGRTVVNVELPWNPVRLEQRVGRVDRLGQRRTVHAAHLFHHDSIEDLVLARLHRRVALASRGGGPLSSIMGSAAVRAVAECAFGGAPPPTLSAFEVSSARVPEARSEAERLTACRRLQSLSGSPFLSRAERGAQHGLISPPRHNLPARDLLCLFEATAIDDQHRLAARYVCPVATTIEPRRLGFRATRDLFAELARHGRLNAAALSSIDAQIRQDAAVARGASTGYTSRVAALQESAGRRPATVQGSLFDGRAKRLAADRAGRRASRLAHFQRRAASVAALGELRLAEPPRLVAMWSVEPRTVDGRRHI